MQGMGHHVNPVSCDIMLQLHAHESTFDSVYSIVILRSQHRYCYLRLVSCALFFRLQNDKLIEW